MNRQRIYDGVISRIEEVLKEQYKARLSELQKEAEFLEEVILLKELAKQYPLLGDTLTAAANEKTSIYAHTQIHQEQRFDYLTWEEKKQILAALELLDREQLRSYTLDELASLVKP